METKDVQKNGGIIGPPVDEFHHCNGNVTKPVLNSPRRRSQRPDGGWGWVVCFASFYCNGIVFGILNTFGVIYVYLKDKFSETHDNAAFLTSWVGSVAIGVTFLMSPLSSILTDKLGIRRTVILGGIISATGMLLSSFVELLELLYLTYGIIMGLGASLIYTPSLVILGHYFDRKMGLVNGIVCSGSAVFTVAMPKALESSIESFGLQHTMQGLAAMLALTILSALVFKPLIIGHHDHRRQQHINNNVVDPGSNTGRPALQCLNIFKKLIRIEIWRNRQYVLWVMAIPSALFGYFVPFVHLVQYVRDTLPESDAAIPITCMGAASGVGRLIFGKIADIPRFNRLHLQQLAFFMIGLCTMLLVAADSMVFVVILCIVMGLFDGCFISLLGPIAFDIVGTKNASQAIGFMLGLCSIPLMIGPPVAGALYDHMKNYDIAFIVAGISPFIGAAMICYIHHVRPSFPAMSMENIVEEAFCTSPEIFKNGCLLNGDVPQEKIYNDISDCDRCQDPEDPLSKIVDLNKISFVDEDEIPGK